MQGLENTISFQSQSLYLEVFSQQNSIERSTISQRYYFFSPTIFLACCASMKMKMLLISSSIVMLWFLYGSQWPSGQGSFWFSKIRYGRISWLGLIGRRLLRFRRVRRESYECRLSGPFGKSGITSFLTKSFTMFLIFFGDQMFGLEVGSNRRKFLLQLQFFCFMLFGLDSVYQNFFLLSSLGALLL